MYRLSIGIVQWYRYRYRKKVNDMHPYLGPVIIIVIVIRVSLSALCGQTVYKIENCSGYDPLRLRVARALDSNTALLCKHLDRPVP